MQRVWLQLAGDEAVVARRGSGRGRWRIGPALRLAAQSAQFAIEMQVTNRPSGRNRCSMCAASIRLHSRCGIPPESAGAGAVGDALRRELLCSDDLSRYVDQAEFFMLAPQGRRYVTRFATGQFNYGLRRIAVQGNRRLLALSSRRTVARMRRKERQR